MATSPEFSEYIVDLLTPHYSITTRKMFGGVGIFCEYGMCALITGDDVLHFKVDDENRADYETAGMSQFHKMPYYQTPVELLDSPEELGAWLAKSIEAARRSPKKKKK
ncbi:MAG: TfoX/Sxy family protein [Chloroflexi bacterium]|nr:TfoX/Sxy family protein [Chloroflexota bacterium]